MNFFFDENLSPQVAPAVSILHRNFHPEDNFFAFRDLYPLGTADVVWIQDLGQRGGLWTVVTKDQMSETPEWSLVQSSGFFWFFLDRGWGNLPYWIIAWRLVRAWPGIVRAAGGTVDGRTAEPVPDTGNRIFSVNPESEIQPRLGRA